MVPLYWWDRLILDWHFLEHFKSSCLGLFFPVLEQVAALKATTTSRHNSPRRKPIVQVGLKNPDSLLHRQSYAFEAFLLFTVTTLESEDRRSSPLRCSAPPLPVQRPKNGQTPEPPEHVVPFRRPLLRRGSSWLPCLFFWFACWFV